MPTRVLITGASGLIGSQVLAHWNSAEFGAMSIGRPECDLLAGGSAAALIHQLRPDVVLHLAWAASGMPGYRQSDDNARWVRTTLQMFEASVQIGARFIATGSAVDQSDSSTDAYTASKRLLWHELEPAVTEFQATWLRPFYVFDPQLRRPAVVAAALAAHDAGSALALQNPFGTHDFVHVSDVGRAINVCLAHEMAGVVPIGAGQVRGVGELVSALGVEWTGGTTQPDQPTQHNEHADVSRLLAAGWQPTATEAFFSPDLLLT